MRYGDLARLQAVLGGKLFVWKTELALHDIDEKGNVRSGEEGAPKEHVVNDEMLEASSYAATWATNWHVLDRF